MEIESQDRHFYGADLAHAHADGFANLWDGAADWLAGLALSVCETPFVVDIGCGDGRMLAELAARDIKGHGFDIAQPFVTAARARGLDADVGDARNIEIPSASVIYALGEVLAYEDSSGSIALEQVVVNAARSLLPGWFLIFDVTTPKMSDSMGWREEHDWMVASRTSITDVNRLERQIITFRREGSAWRRSKEVHKQRLLDVEFITAMLHESGFAVELLSSFGDVTLLPGRQGYLAKKA